MSSPRHHKFHWGEILTGVCCGHTARFGVGLGVSFFSVETAAKFAVGYGAKFVVGQSASSLLRGRGQSRSRLYPIRVQEWVL